MKGYSVNTEIIVVCGVRFSLHIGAYGTLAEMCKEGRVGCNSTCHASNYCSHLRQLYRRLNSAFPIYCLS